VDLQEFLFKFSTGNDEVPVEEPMHSLVRANNYAVARKPTSVLEVLDSMSVPNDVDILNLCQLVRARACLQLARADEAIELLDTIDPDPANTLLKARVALSYGIAYRLSSNTEKALLALSLAKTYYTELDIALDAALCEVELGSLLLGQGDVGAATSCYLSALDVIEAAGLDTLTNAVRMNLATAMQRAGNNEGAEKELRTLLERHPFDKPGGDRARLLHNLAVIMKLSKRYQQSLELYEEALACIDVGESPVAHIHLRVGIAELAFRVGDILTAEAQLSEVERLITPDNQDNMVSVEYYSLRSRVHGLSERLHEAQELLNLALDAARKSDLVDEEYLLLRESLDWVFGPMRMRYLEDIVRIQEVRNEKTARGITSLIELRARYEQEKSAREIERQQEITRTVLETQTRMFEEIGRDIHDSVGQDLTVLRLMTERLTSGQFPTREMEDIHTRMHEIVRRVEQDTRRISHLVSGMGCTGLGLRDALSTIKNDIAKGAAQLEIELVISTGLEHIPDDVARTLLRCVQTLLQNILRHSGARTCTVQLLVRSTDIVLSVEDDGVGFDLLRVRKGLGMRELLARTEVVGGKVHIDSAPGCGSFIEIVIPRKDVEA
jgi:signal transduction histidine kinase